jgi:transcriptional regulator with XRE-family HTH domain
MLDMATFAEKLARLCEERNWKRSDLARECGVSPTTAGNWWDGKRRPYDDTLVTIARIFGTTVDFLVDERQDAPAGSALSEDEAYVLRVMRDMQLSASKVVLAIRVATEFAARGDDRAGGDAVFGEVLHDTEAGKAGPAASPGDKPSRKASHR